MGETTNQIEAHIENERYDLGANLKELEAKVKSVTDWREQFRHNPTVLLGLAFGGGVLLAARRGGHSRHRNRRFSSEVSPVSTPPAPIGGQKQKVLETLDNIKGALIGVAATRVTDFLGDMVPEFKNHYNNAKQPRESMH